MYLNSGAGIVDPILLGALSGDGTSYALEPPREQDAHGRHARTGHETRDPRHCFDPASASSLWQLLRRDVSEFCREGAPCFLKQ